jgi:aminoglycoside phosphotransferase (APT) family kinase protein
LQDPLNIPGTSDPAGLLSVDTVSAYLQRRGLAAAGSDVQARTLGGGVSNIVLAAQAGGRRVVVKQSLPQLRVADEWLAKRERALTEAAALRWAATLTPDAVPSVYDVDTGAYAITIARAADEWHDWKQLLLTGDIDPAVATRLGEVLAAWHGASGAARVVAAQFDDAEAFDQLRVDPYYRAIMARHPGLASEIAGYIDRMQSTHRCVVHGDYSPKNVLVGVGGMWVIDFEVAHLGDPAFDLAFMLNHLLLKAMHRPADTNAYERCAFAFWNAYRARVPAGFAGPTSYVLGHVGCLMLARVDGKSPAEYLLPLEQAKARTLSITLLKAPPTELGEAWARLRMEVRE